MLGGHINRYYLGLRYSSGVYFRDNILNIYSKGYFKSYIKVLSGGDNKYIIY